MKTRFNPFAAAPDAYKAVLALETYVAKDSGLPHRLIHLIKLRASILNGCAFCVDMHVKEAKIHGERELRLYHLAAWRESPLFSAREKAALAFTEALTQIGVHGVSDALYRSVAEHFSDVEISELNFAIVAINAWNRLGITSRMEPGSLDAAYGLNKANLE